MRRQVQSNCSSVLDLSDGLNDADRNASRIIGHQQPKYGTVYRDVFGRLVYTPRLGYRGGDSFSITLSDGKVTTTATVRLQVGQSKGLTANGTLSFNAEAASAVREQPRSYMIMDSTLLGPAALGIPAIDWDASPTRLAAPVGLHREESQKSLAEETGLKVRVH